jgi:hypothetical protein
MAKMRMPQPNLQLTAASQLVEVISGTKKVPDKPGFFPKKVSAKDWYPKPNYLLIIRLAYMMEAKRYDGGQQDTLLDSLGNNHR